ncbi:MAG: lipoate--protein ligase [Candidatus Ranarchaeia archaeon]|jgi:lipoate-protein ligase A
MVKQKQTWRVVDLGYQEPYIANTLYESVAYEVALGNSSNTILYVNPKDPYVCVGLHQDARKEIDLEYVAQNRYPVIRRTQGGGAVFLDSGQLFYQFILRSSDVPAETEQLFKWLLMPVVKALRALGLPAEFKPINDILTNGRKISGNGAGVIDDATILVGNVICNIDSQKMARVLKVPSEKFRDKLAQNISQWVTSLDQEMNPIPSRDVIIKTLTDHFESDLNIVLEKGSITQSEWDNWKTIKEKHLSKEWVFQPGAAKEDIERKVKIHSDLKLVEVAHKGQKMVKITATLHDNKINDILFSGDFFISPIDALDLLQQKLIGVILERETILKVVTQVLEAPGVNRYGIPLQDFVEAIMKLSE